LPLLSVRPLGGGSCFRAGDARPRADRTVALEPRPGQSLALRSEPAEASE
jgi:hypothetical protein